MLPFERVYVYFWEIAIFNVDVIVEVFTLLFLFVEKAFNVSFFRISCQTYMIIIKTLI